MKTYIFFTPEGSAQSPNDSEVYTLQILGYEHGASPEKAREKLLRHNRWISDGGFSAKAIRWHAIEQ